MYTYIHEESIIIFIFWHTQFHIILKRQLINCFNFRCEVNIAKHVYHGVMLYVSKNFKR